MTPALINDLQTDTLREIFNIGAGQGASVLNSMLQAHIHLNVPSISALDVKDLKEKISGNQGESFSTIEMGFKGNINGSSLLFFPKDSARKLVSALTGQEIGNEDEDEEDGEGLIASTMNEVGNIVMNGVIGAISNVLEYTLVFSVPNYTEDGEIDLTELSGLDEKSIFLFANTVFAVKDLNISGDIIIVLGLDTFGEILRKVDSLIESYDAAG